MPKGNKGKGYAGGGGGGYQGKPSGSHPPQGGGGGGGRKGKKPGGGGSAPAPAPSQPRVVVIEIPELSAKPKETAAKPSVPKEPAAKESSDWPSLSKEPAAKPSAAKEPRTWASLSSEEKQKEKAKPVEEKEKQKETPSPSTSTETETKPAGGRKERHRDSEVETHCSAQPDAKNTWKIVSLDTNHFNISIASDVYEYAAVFEPDLGDSSKRKVLVRNRKIPNMIVLMGNCLYTTKLIPEELLQWTVSGREAGMSEPVSITLSVTHTFKKGTLFPGHVFSALLQRALLNMGYKQIQRNFFDLTKKFVVGEKYDIFPGLDISVSPSAAGFDLVCDITNKVTRRENILGMSEKVRGDKFWKELEGKVVRTRYNNRFYTVQRVMKNMNPSDMFELADGKRKTFAKYVEERYGLRISTNEQPMLECTNSGSEVFLIPEFCQPTGLDDRDRSNRELMEKISLHLFPKPSERQKMIQNSVSVVKSSKVADMGVSPPVKVEASLIPLPRLPFMKARDNLTRKNTCIRQGGKPLKNLLIVHSSYFRIDKLADVMENSMSEIGLADMEISELSWSSKFPRLDGRFCEDMKRERPDCVLFVSPSKNDKNLYRDIKSICTDQLHVPSQVVTEQSLKNPSRALNVMLNVARQMAVKIGKVPWIMPFNKSVTDGTMVFGLDVCHSTPIHKSVVGIVATLDDSFGRYFSGFIVQDRGKEVVGDLRPFVTKALEKYKKNNGKYPKKILFLRDGVGDGQLFDVNEREVAVIRETIQAQSRDSTLTFVVVKKHIRTRLFNAGNNPTPGTVVDKAITNPHWYDFFLVSHETRNGTVSPTHYNVLLDEIKWPKNELQYFIYLLCYQYFNWDGSISVPAPCQYAHKMAFLYGRTLLMSPDERKSVPRELEDTLLQI